MNVSIQKIVALALFVGGWAWLVQGCWGPGLPVGSACQRDFDCQEDSVCEGKICILINGSRPEVAPDARPEPTPPEEKKAEPTTPEEKKIEPTPEERVPDAKPPACANSPRVGQACTVGNGACQGTGKWLCQADGSLRCDAIDDPSKKSTELCNGKDDDCNGQLDDLAEPTRACYTGPAGTAGKGTCTKGTEICSGGDWGSCLGEQKPAAEVCDGKDNNCDGTVDEGTGLCPAGEKCTGGKCVAQCTEPKALCGGQCIDVGMDNNNCGKCGTTCTGGTVCCAGKCVDTKTSKQHCGKCGGSCPLTCCSGICTDLDQDRSNCGKCGNMCTTRFCDLGKCR